MSEGNLFLLGVYKNIKGWCIMIKPLNSVSNVTFKSGLEDYQDQIRNKVEPKYQLTLSPGSDYVPPKKSFKQGVANIFKGFNNVTGVASGTVKGAVKGILFGSIAGAAAKNWKDKTTTVITEAGKKIPKTDVAGAIGNTIGDIFGVISKAFKAIPEVFSKTPKETWNNIKGLPGKYIAYLGESKAVRGIAIGVAALTLVYNIVKSKIHANRKNADIDHSWNLKH